MPPLQFSKTPLFPAPTVQVILATQSPDSHLTNHAPASGPALTLVPPGLALTSFLQDPPSNLLLFRGFAREGWT